MKTPLEMYSQAYELDFIKGKPLQARELYLKIIREFPDSEEREYADIHLERIEKISGRLDLEQETKSNVSVRIPVFSILSIINSVFILLLLVLGIFAIVALKDIRRQIICKDELLLHTYFLNSGKEQWGINGLGIIQQERPNQIVIYRILIHYYIDHHEFNSARKELNIWKQVDPENAEILAYERYLAQCQRGSSLLRPPSIPESGNGR